jgi:hypothetical protein
MIATARVQQSYDHRLKLRVFAGDENALAASKRLHIPRSTIHGWKRACKSVVTDRDVDPCQESLQSQIERLHCENQKLCSHAFPNQLTSDEVRTIREIVTSDEYRHVPTRNLATLAACLGKVYASSSTWLRLIHLHG